MMKYIYIRQVTEVMDNFDMLNSIYKPLCDKSTDICRDLTAAGYHAKAQFHNNHSVKRNNDFATELFPIPVISVEKHGDIGIDVDSIWFEAVLPKEKAVLLDYAEITHGYKIEIYGCEDFLCDLYNELIDVSEIVGNISNSTETNICILFYLPKDASDDELIEIIRLIAE